MTVAQRAAYRPTPVNPNTPAPQPSGSTTSDDTDDLLDEIDAVLDEEEEFAVKYRQKGGQ